jgi:hypothetical protein
MDLAGYAIDTGVAEAGAEQEAWLRHEARRASLLERDLLQACGELAGLGIADPYDPKPGVELPHGLDQRGTPLQRRRPQPRREERGRGACRVR